jgi:hypothetical protein
MPDLPGAEVVRESLSHFPGEVLYSEGGLVALVIVGDLRLAFEVLEEPEPVGFGGVRWVDFMGVV